MDIPDSYTAPYCNLTLILQAIDAQTEGLDANQ